MSGGRLGSADDPLHGLSRRGKRERIVELTGQEDVPVLVTDAGTVVAGPNEIVEWAGAHPAG